MPWKGNGVSEEADEAGIRDRMSGTVRQIVSRRERAPRSPRMERALKRLILRYNRMLQSPQNQEGLDVQK